MLYQRDNSIVIILFPHATVVAKAFLLLLCLVKNKFDTCIEELIFFPLKSFYFLICVEYIPNSDQRCKLASF